MTTQGEKVLHVAAMCDKLEREQNATLTSFCPEDVPADGTGAETDDPATVSFPLTLAC